MGTSSRNRIAGASRALLAWSWLLAALAPRGGFALAPDKDLAQYPRASWSEEQGVVGQFVLTLAETRDGFLWLGTRSGLLRFDGATFTPQRSDDPNVLGNERVEALLSEADGRLWIGTDKGVVRLHDGRFELIYASSEPVHELVHARDGGVWVATTKGLRKLVGARAMPFEGEALLDHLSVRAVLETDDGGMWIGADEGLFRLHAGRLQTFDGPEQPGRFAVRALLQAPEGELWIGTAGPRLFRHHMGRFSSETLPQMARDAAVTDLARDGDGNLWIGTPLGLARRSSRGDLRMFSYGQGLADARVASLLIDDEQNLWVGTKSGLVMFHDGDFTTLTTLQGLPSDSIKSVLYAHGKIWIASDDEGLVVWDRGKVVRQGAEQGLPATIIRTLFQDPEGVLWVGTAAGLFRLERERFVPVLAEGAPPRPDVGSIARARAGGLWIGTKGNGLMRYQGGRLVPHATLRRLFGWIRPVYEDGNGRVWLATNDGRLMRLGEGGKLVETPVGTARYPRAFHERDGALWVGFRGALARLRDGAWRAWTTNEGLPATSMSQIIEDDRGNLWLGGAIGIFRVGRQELEEWLDGNAERPGYRTFRRSDGLKSTECSLQPGTAKTPDGRLWFPTTGGVAVVDPLAAGTEIAPPRVHILEVDVDGTVQPLRGSIVVPPGPGTISVRYTAPYFREPHKLRFRYRLEGFDARWVEGDDRRFARYNSVPPGRYRFVVEARNSEGLWPPQYAAIALAITPRFFQTRLFMAVMSALALGLGVLVVWLRAAAARRRQALVQAERTRIARDLHDNLDQSLFATTLQLDLANKVLPEPERARSHITTARNLLSRFQEEARRSIADLRAQALEESQGALQQAIRKTLESLPADGGVDIDIVVARGVERASPRIKNELLRITQELTANALRHARPTRVSVHMTAQGAGVELVVCDDGRGFDPASVAGPGQGHFGLTGVRERTRWLGGQLTITSRQPSGTTIRLFVPFKSPPVNPG